HRSPTPTGRCRPMRFGWSSSVSSWTRSWRVTWPSSKLRPPLPSRSTGRTAGPLAFPSLRLHDQDVPPSCLRVPSGRADLDLDRVAPRLEPSELQGTVCPDLLATCPLLETE